MLTPPVDPLPDSFHATTPRLDKIVAAFQRRQVSRPQIDWTLFDAQEIAPEHRGAVVFALSQMYFTETVSPQNLATLARSTPNAALRLSYSAQMQDEYAHGQMLGTYLKDHLQVDAIEVHPVSRLACQSALLLQRDPVMGALGVMMGIEFFAVEVMAAISDVVKEPLLNAIFDHINVDENRHKALAVEAASLLSASPLMTGAKGRARLAVGRAAVESFFKWMTCPVYQKHCAPLGVSVREV